MPLVSCNASRTGLSDWATSDGCTHQLSTYACSYNLRRPGRLADLSRALSCPAYGRCVSFAAIPDTREDYLIRATPGWMCPSVVKPRSDGCSGDPDDQIDSH